jgi:uncharacterized small protein (DUF1192 family)
LETRQGAHAELIPRMKRKPGRQGIYGREKDQRCFTIDKGLGPIKEILSVQEIVDGFAADVQERIKRLNAQQRKMKYSLRRQILFFLRSHQHI